MLHHFLLLGALLLSEHSSTLVIAFCEPTAFFIPGLVGLMSNKLYKSNQIKTNIYPDQSWGKHVPPLPSASSYIINSK